MFDFFFASTSIPLPARGLRSPQRGCAHLPFPFPRNLRVLSTMVAFGGAVLFQSAAVDVATRLSIAISNLRALPIQHKTIRELSLKAPPRAKAKSTVGRGGFRRPCPHRRSRDKMTKCKREGSLFELSPTPLLRPIQQPTTTHILLKMLSKSVEADPQNVVGRRRRIAKTRSTGTTVENL